ncbi:hypothetical protein [Xanthomonas graminis]|jgi:hypothetical protein|uniref:hypothetical protein n=1 Tax=Xanthomonas graminis TaxID=3390026 RepID=UPI001112DE66|nr:hypothetical protein [Xanthomonas translucens]
MRSGIPENTQSVVDLVSHYANQRKSPLPKAGSHICVHIDDLQEIEDVLKKLSARAEALEQSQLILAEAELAAASEKKGKL